MSTRTPLSCRIGFNAQHSPMGAYMSFTCGNFGTRGGIGVQLGQPADQDVFVGIMEGPRGSAGPITCLPFYSGCGVTGAEAFLVEQAAAVARSERPELRAFGLEHIQRYYGWCTDAWRAGPLNFTLYTPFGPIPDPSSAPEQAVREALLPAVLARLVVDNRQGSQTRTGFLALGLPRPGVRVLEADELGASGRCGFAFRRELGVAAEIGDATSPAAEASEKLAPFVFARWTVADGLHVSDRQRVHLVCPSAGIGFEVPAGRCYTMTIAIGSYLDGVQTVRLEGRYLYASYYGSLADVLSSALDRASALVERAEALDRQLEASALSSEQQLLVAHATHSYYGSTQLLQVEGRPLWVVNEGEYCHMNTLDLSVDHLFWELEHNPWVVRNQLETFVAEYSYVDQVKEYEGAGDAGSLSDAPSLARSYRLRPGGISFCHDMGTHNTFAPKGHSSYEVADLTGTFSYMTQEELCNWILLATCYVAKTRDLPWLERHGDTVASCLESMIHRGGERGFAQYDSARCGLGAEITTYDSLDPSLAQTRSNLYIAVKCWATYRALAWMFAAVNDEVRRREAHELAVRVASVVAEQPVDAVLPAIFERSSPGHGSRILPAIEGCVYPLYLVGTGFTRETLEQVFGGAAELRMFEVLREHTRSLLLDPERRNLFDDGGIKLSSTSHNSWMSKIAIVMHVARRVFGLDRDPRIAEVFRSADRAHVRWQTEGSAYWACSDQLVSGEAKGSRYYPRVITTALWLT